MKALSKTIFLCLIAVTSLFITTSHADELKRSTLGYQVLLPDSIVMIPRELFSKQTRLPKGHFLQQIIPPLLQAGQTDSHDFYFWKDTLHKKYKEHIRIGVMNERPPQDRVGAEQFCANFQVILSTLYQRNVQIYQCTYIENQRQPILYTEYDGANSDSLIMTVHSSLNSEQAIEVTASTLKQNADVRRKDFLSFINGIN